jgi:hypothetical protein
LADEIDQTSTANNSQAYYETKGYYSVGIARDHRDKRYKAKRKPFSYYGVRRKELKLKELAELNDYISMGIAKLNTL